MIDIHTHILPKVDDGPNDWEESIEMIQQGIKDGIKGAICTSHVLDRLDENTEEKLLYKFDQLKSIVNREKLPISLWLGSEIHCQSQFDYRSPVATFNRNQKYLLFELPLGNIPSNVNETLFHLTLERILPILAHPERNTRIMESPKLAFEFVNRGVLLQMNAGSITGEFGKRVKKTASELMNHRLIHFVGSDCHTPRSRPMILSEAYQVVRKDWGEDTADTLFRKNPMHAIQGTPISFDNAIPFEEKYRRKGFFRSRK